MQPMEIALDLHEVILFKYLPLQNGTKNLNGFGSCIFVCLLLKTICDT